MRRLIAAAVFSLAGLPVFAQTETCPYRDQIVTASWDILETRPNVGGIGGYRIGEDAAYLILRYADPAEYLVSDVWAALETGRRPHPMLPDLQLTYAMWKAGAVVALGVEDDPAGRIMTATWSPRRALILADEGQTYLRLADEVAEFDEVEGFYTDEPSFSQYATSLVLDQSDAFKFAFAVNAETAGRPLLTAFLLADLSDLAAYRAFVETMEDGPLKDFALHPDGGGIGVVNGNSPITPRPGLESSYGVLRSPLYMSPMDFVLIAVNQSGDADGLNVAVDALAAAQQAGEFDPVVDMDQAWLIAFDAWAAEFGPDRALRVLSGFTMPSNRLRHYADLASVTLAGMSAAQRLGPYAAGQGQDLPEPHLHLPYPEGWLEVASAMRAGAEVPAGQAAIAAELNWAVGDIEGLFAQAVRLEPADRARVLTDFIKRMDRHCEAATFAPMQALTLGGAHFWDFPQN